ncbi:MAG: site-specific integrase [Rickettsiales bacterium]|nr:site-specific integrase [Pseudomonadota bacterium]MDA0966866.1 site-specific integrase [Pseudomonadota bacterium]MDG4543541.1 site-specific integrase [Rickettsiales bacterium]MDG4545689.1 site-specific integrase [Rickettsiales bacterium]MDG4547538.1 site-specific integrase [Rickettsiales bacterium]
MADFEKKILVSGRAVYRARVRIKGYPVASATFDKKRDAVAWAAKIETEIREGRYDKNSAAKKYTMADAIDRYINDVLPIKSKKTRYISQQKGQLLWWRARIGAYTLINITPAVVTKERDLLRRRVASATANRYLAALSHVMTKAYKEWDWITENPMKKATKFKEPRGRVRFLNESERDALLIACRQSSCKYLHLIVLIAISTGARKGEILNLRWEDYDCMRRQIVVQETKNDERRTLYLRGRAAEHFKGLYVSLKQPKEGWVFASRNKGQPIEIDLYWRAAVKQAKLKDFRFHDLRHTAASYLAMNGTSLAAIAELLGHKTLNMVKRYAHLSESHSAEQIEAMNKKVFG